MTLAEEIAAAREAAEAFAAPGEEVVGVVPAEPPGSERVFLCAFSDGAAEEWLALDGEGNPLAERERVREAASIAALCELAEESAGGGDLDELRARLAEIRAVDNPEGIDEAEAAAASLAETLREPPRVANAAYLDEIGAAANRLERALGDPSASPFANAMQAGVGAAEAIAARVQESYKTALG